MSTPTLDRHFALRKLHSLLGLVPIGAFLAFHLFENSMAVKGEAYFTEHVIHKIGNLPYVELLEIFVIAVPILFHGLYGLWIWRTGRSNARQYGYARNWMYVLQRISGAVAMVFILVHVYQTRFQVLIGALDKDELYARMVEILANPAMQAWYALGVLASVFHLANGLWLFGVTWGITIGPRSQRISTYVTSALGVVVFVLGVRALFGFGPVGV
jgi:succinate dehydrogenase / fumarate reductase cytochrome b subunit